MYKFQTHQLCSLLFCLNVHNVSSLSLSLPSLSHSSFATRQDLAVNVFKRSVEKKYRLGCPKECRHRGEKERRSADTVGL